MARAVCVRRDRLGVFWTLAAMILLGCFLAPRVSFAEDEPPAKAKQAEPTNNSEVTAGSDESMLIWIIKAAGFFFAPLLLLMSILVVGMIVLFAMQLRTPNFVPKEFVDSFEQLYKEKKFQEAYELARNNESYVARMLSAGISRLSSGQTQAVEAMEEQAIDESMRYEHNLNYLAMMGNVATMVGLLGTVVGMVNSFMVIALSGTAPKPDKLAGGVSTALVTTVWGLAIAIPAILALTFLKNRMARLTFEAGRVGELLMGRFSSQTKRKE